MPLLQHETRRVPIGMNDGADSSLMAQERCRLMLGVSPRDPGQLEKTLWTRLLKALANDTNDVLCGLFPYYADNPANDKLCAIHNGVLYTATVVSGAPNAHQADTLDPTIDALTAITNSSGITLPGSTGPFTSAMRCRAAQFGSELIIVTAAGLQPVRFDGTTLYKLGITAPAAPALGAAGVGALTGVFDWLVTYADSALRESNPSAVSATATLSGQGQNIVLVASADAQVSRIFLYRRTANGTLYYRVDEAGFANTSATVLDATTDVNLILNTQAPVSGENDIPNTASVVTVWKNHVVLNDTTDSRAYQMSNLDAPGAYSQLGIAGIATDGITQRILERRGDQIVNLGHMGTALGIWGNQSVGVVLGDRPSNFQYHCVQPIGLIAPDSIAEGINETFFMGEDGVYAFGYDQGFSLRKVSGDLNKMFRSVAVPINVDPQANAQIFSPSSFVSKDTRGTAAIGFYAQNRYALCVPPYACVLDTENGGWSLEYMVGVPWNLDAVPYAYLGGYQCGCTMNVERKWNLILFAPGRGPGGVSSGIYTSSFYPLQQVARNTLPYYVEYTKFAYLSRAFDGAGVHRASKKATARVRVFGEWDCRQVDRADLGLAGGTEIDGSLTVTVYCDITSENASDAQSHYESQTIALTPALTTDTDTNIISARNEGLLYEGEFVVSTGRLIEVLVAGYVTGGRVIIRDVLVEYDRLDPS